MTQVHDSIIHQEKTNLNLGLAARYLINNLSTEQTLVLNKKMTLDALIPVRLKAGVSIAGQLD
ncbi:hypothetical protein V6259_17660 [Marinomonas sp. TI.3.20]|uniref:hypothetical protein n=1 Tax=Marinomonas sp. TI.3.20 TaxID=3121296 RepID=UPI00311FCC3B